MFQVGLTGNTGSGKTTAGDYFAKLGITVIEADLVAKKVLADHIDEIVTHFGQAACTAQGCINTHYLKNCIFNNPKDKMWLENIIHPKTRHAIKQYQLASSSRYTITILPLLDKNNRMLYQFDHICLITASYQKKCNRVRRRDNISTALFSQIIQTQPKELALHRLADTTIDNNATLSALESQIRELDVILTRHSQEKKT